MKSTLLLNACPYAQSIKPKYADDANLFERPYAIKAGCGKCEYCRKQRSRGWIYRLLSEHNKSSSSMFVTMTYEDDNIYTTPNGLPSLHKQHFQKFMKRLRKKTPLELKYYCTGEYGGRTQRPHYHAVMFNANAQHIVEEWHEGNLQIGYLTAGSMAYVTGYVNKYRIEKGVDRHEDDDRQIEFNLISQGIGKDLATPSLHQYIGATGNTTTRLRGDRYKIPKYIIDKLNLTDKEKVKIMEKNKLYKHEQEILNNLMQPKNLKKWLESKQLQSDLNRFKKYQLLTF